MQLGICMHWLLQMLRTCTFAGLTWHTLKQAPQRKAQRNSLHICRLPGATRCSPIWIATTCVAISAFRPPVHTCRTIKQATHCAGPNATACVSAGPPRATASCKRLSACLQYDWKEELAAPGTL